MVTGLSNLFGGGSGLSADGALLEGQRRLLEGQRILMDGQRKLLDMGRALAMDVHTHLFDEPFAGLFPQMLERVKTLLKRMRDDGRAIIFVSHNMDLVRELADHLIVLDSGQLLVEGDVDEVLSRPEVIEAYLGV